MKTNTECERAISHPSISLSFTSLSFHKNFKVMIKKNRLSRQLMLSSVTCASFVFMFIHLRDNMHKLLNYNIHEKDFLH